MQKVEGYQISDGRFFHDVNIARFEEARVAITLVAEKSIQVTKQYLPAFLDFLEEHPQLVIDYCTSYKKCEAQKGANDLDPEILLMQEGEKINDTSKKPSKA
jgi:hypothetical protein